MRGNTYSESFKNSFASFVQAWLYFGLIAEFLGPPFNRSDWIQKTCDGISIVSTAKLPGRLDAWRKEVLEMQDAQKSCRKTDLDYLLDRAHNFHAVISCGKDVRAYSDLLPEDLSLSIQILHATLVFARNSVFPDTPMSIPRQPILKTLSDQFRSNGWCTSDVTRLRQDTSVLGEYYATRLGQLTCLSDHHLCNENTCSASQIKMETYKTKHIKMGCDCEFRGVETAHLADHLETVDIPLLTLDMSGEAAKVTLLAERDSTLGYVAISHVWADGLGNPAANKLPLCQLRRIQNQVDALYDEKSSIANHPFWIDTICVPVGEVFTEQRKKAIEGMASVYRLADKVLIFNEELRQVDIKRSPIELAARASRTQWFRRLWTLHEGVLSRDSYFQFKDAAVSMQKMIDSGNTSVSAIKESDLEFVLLREACAPMLKMSIFREISNNQRIKHIWTAVQWRTTSCPEDETICLANMLGLNLDTILGIPRHSPDVLTERMKAFIRLQRYFPANSLFEAPRGGDRLNIEGYRWAPKSFVFRHTASRTITDDCPLEAADESGLLGTFQGLGLTWADVIDGSRDLAFTIVQDWDYWYSMSWLECNTRPWYVDREMISNSNPVIIFEEDIAPLDLQEELKLVFDYDQTMADDVDQSRRTVFFNHCEAAFVAVRKEQGGVLKGDLIGRVHVYKRQFGTSTIPAWKQVDGPARNNMKEQADLRCFEKLPGARRWCIG